MLHLDQVINFCNNINLEHFLNECWGHDTFLKNHFMSKINVIMDDDIIIRPAHLIRFMSGLSHGNLDIVEKYIAKNHM